MKEMETKVTVKEAISKWCSAVDYHNTGAYHDAVQTYLDAGELSARMYYNLACAYIKLEKKEHAIQCLSSAMQKDEHLVVAFFQRGTFYLQSKRIQNAITDLEMARLLLRGNSYIDYKPLGLYLRLSSCQILHNLALAYAHDERVADAKNLLREALHDADDVQRKSLEKALGRMNENRPDLVPVLQISADKVFAPPKHVTQNLEKRGIVRKAKVVSATNADDRNPAFEGSKRVRELKEMPASPKSSLEAAKRFLQNTLPTSRSTSDIGGLAENNRMTKSKSLGDISNKVIASKSPMAKIKRLFKKKPSFDSQSQISLEMNAKRSSGELATPFNSIDGGNGMTSPRLRNQYTGVRKLLNNKRKGRNSDPSLNEGMPVLMMRGCGSTGDLRKLGNSLSFSDSEGESTGSSDGLSRSSAEFYEKLNFESSGDRRSLGSVFGDYLTVTRLGLSLSCDVLTAVVTPTESPYDDDAFEPSDAKSGLEIEKEHSYVNARLDNRIESHTLNPGAGSQCSKSGSESKTSNLQNNMIRQLSNTRVKVMIGTPSPKLKTNTTIGQYFKADTRKPRPPPPSYPPPPLPLKVVIDV